MPLLRARAATLLPPLFRGKLLPAGQSNECQSHLFSKDPNRISAFEFVLRAPSPRAILSFLSPFGTGNLPGQSDQG